MPEPTLLETPPPAAPPAQRSRFGRLDEDPSQNGLDALAMLDEVTGLRDSRALWKELAQRAASCSVSSPLALVVLDFDRLADVNAHYDRSVGDAVLRRCAKVTGEEVPSARLAFRYREDELVLLVPGDEEEGRELAERVRARIAAQNSTLPAVTVSCGVAVIHAPVEPMVALGKAGPALQAAKRSGGNRVVVATETSRNNGHNGSDDEEGTACRAALAMAVASLEARDRATAAHSDDVVTLADSIGRRLGLSELQLDRLTAAAQLHDVGKLAMPTEILNKPGPLNDDEWAVIREHTVIGERMLRAVPEMGAVANMVRHSHERWDGTGYPDGLAGEEIPLASRIILCADAFHAIRSDRPYRPGRTADEALTEVRRYAGEQFDPRVVEALVAIARDVRRAGKGIAVPRSRRLAALLATLVVCGGGSAYAASEHVRNVVDEVVKAVTPATVLRADEAKAGAPDFALRPIDQVPDIVPVSIITPDLELAPFQGEASFHRTPDLMEGEIDLPVSFIDEPASAESPEQSTAPPAEDVGPQPGPALLVPAPQLASAPVPAVPTDEAAPTLSPVDNVDPDTQARPPADTGNPHGEPPAVGNPHGEPPGQAEDEHVDKPPPLVEPEQTSDEVIATAPPLRETPPETPPADVVEEVPPVVEQLPPVPQDLPAAIDQVEAVLETLPPLVDEPVPPAVGNPHGDPPGQAETDGDQGPVPLPEVEEQPVPTPAVDPKPEQGKPEQPARPETERPEIPAADVVTPTPSIVEPDENVFVPTEPEPGPPPPSFPEQAAVSTPPRSSGAPLPILPPTRPPEEVPASVTTETPTTE